MTSLSKCQLNLDGKTTFSDRIKSFVWTFVKMMKYENGILKSIRDRFLMHPQRTWLSDMPPEIAVMIFENLRCRDRTTLRQVSKAIRTQIDRMKYHVYNQVDLKIHRIDEVELIMDDQYYIFSTDDFKPHYNSRKHLEPVKCVGGFKDAFALLFRLLSASGVETKLFNVDIWNYDDDEIPKIVTETIKSAGNLIAVRSLIMVTSFEDQMVAFMSSMEPGILEEIEISTPGDGVPAEKIMLTEQWKKAKELNMLGLVCPLSSFLHCARFKVLLFDGLADEDLLKIRNTCFYSPTFEFCHLSYDVNVDRVGAILGPKKIAKPDTGKMFLIEYDKDGVIFKQNNHFDFVGLSIFGDESAILKLDGESIEYENGRERNEGNRKSGNWKQALDNLAEVWRIPKVEIEELEVEFHPLGANSSEIEENVKTFFKSFRYKIPVTSLHMRIDSEAQLEAVLPHLEPETLKTIKIDGNGSIGEDEKGQEEYLRIENGLESAQLMKARSLHVKFIELPYDALLQYIECTGFFHEINEAEIVQIKNDFFDKPHLNCSLTLHFRDAFDEEMMNLLLGPSRIEVPGRYFSPTLSIEYETSCIRFRKTWPRYQWGMGQRLMVREIDGSDESDGDVEETDSESEESDVSHQSNESDSDVDESNSGLDESDESESSDL